MDMEWDGWEAGVVSIRTYALDPNGTSWSWRVVGPTGGVTYDAGEHGGWWRSPDAARSESRIDSKSSRCGLNRQSRRFSGSIVRASESLSKLDC